jgi:hypothetical protein
MRRFTTHVILLLLSVLSPALVGVMTPAGATISTSASTVTVPGNGSQTAFTFSFVGVAAADISVIFTTAAGVQTALTQGPGPTQYQVSLNAAVPPALWGVGGTIIYSPGTPIPSGSSLTISRVLPLQQNTSLSNQASLGQLESATEQAIDQAVMQIQQLAGTIGRAIVGNIANSSAPLPLPPAAQAAGQGLCFDGTGNNVIACSLAPAGTISSAMAPVVGAASISAAITALGLDPTASSSTGDMKFRLTAEVLAGWVKLNAQTIGSASSGASQRANADTQNLFVYEWNNCPDTHCPVGGGRGASGLADFTANKQITLPDCRGRICGVGLDDMGNSLAGRIAASNITSGGGDVVTTPGASGGEANHTLVAGELPSITPTFTGTNAPIQVGNGGTVAVNTAGQTDCCTGGPNPIQVSNSTTNLTGNFTPNGTISTFGSNLPHNNMGPFMLGTWYVKL